jgi:alpha/beta superfamily hydrolase
VNDTVSLTLRTADGLTLEAELARTDPAGAAPRAAVVLCHPHPQYGGTMRSLVTSTLFDALPGLANVCLRFNVRGVEGSAGSYGEGREEPLDIVAGIEAIAAEAPSVPVVLVAWSFGADMALQVADARVAGWVAIAPPLRFRSTFPVAADPRPKHLILGEHDEYRAPAEIQAEVAAWSNTTTAVISGASHFFVGRTDRVTTEAQVGIDRAVRFLIRRTE